MRADFEVVERRSSVRLDSKRQPLETETTILEGLRKYLDLRPGVVLDPPGLMAATRMIEGFFKSKGSGDVKVEISFELPSATEAVVIFKISPVKIEP